MSVGLLETMDCAQFGDERLTKRLVTIVDRLSSKPNMSIPAAMNGRAEMEAADRFFDNPKVTPEAILAPHIAATLERVRQTGLALFVQDTTEIDVTRPEQQVVGAGPMSRESRRGAFYHPLFAFDADGLPLGTIWSTFWARETSTEDTPRAEAYKRLPLEQKESRYWLDGLRAARAAAQTCPHTQCLCVADSGADVYEMLIEPRALSDHRELHLVIRASSDRALLECENRLWDTLRATPCWYQAQIHVSRRSPLIKSDPRRRHQERGARMAKVAVRASTVTLRPPWRNDRKLPAVTVNAVLVEELDPPQDETPIEWLLLTTLRIDTEESIRQIILYYSLRWEIEVYFKTLKSGCRIESRYFERLERLLNCVTVYTIVAWKVLYLCRLSEQCPDLDGEVVFDPSEWKSVFMAIHREPPPKTPPSINVIIRLIASLGGYVIRKANHPGTQTLWFGLQRLHDLSTAWKAFGPDVPRNQFY